MCSNNMKLELRAVYISKSIGYLRRMPDYMIVEESSVIEILYVTFLPNKVKFKLLC